MPVAEARELPVQPLRPDQGLAVRGLPADRGRQAGARPQPRQLLRRRGAVGVQPGQLRARHRALARQDAAGAPVRLRRTRSATGSASTTPSCPSTGRTRPRPRNYGRDGYMRFDGNGGRSHELRAEQLRRARPDRRADCTRRWRSTALDRCARGGEARRRTTTSSRPAPLPGDEEDEREARLVANIAGSLSQVGRPEIIERTIEHFRKADADYGTRMARAVRALRK